VRRGGTVGTLWLLWNKWLRINTSVYLSSLLLAWLLKMMGIVMMVDYGG
jgi:hypothetical protein